MQPLSKQELVSVTGGEVFTSTIILGLMALAVTSFGVGYAIGSSDADSSAKATVDSDGTTTVECD